MNDNIFLVTSGIYSKTGLSGKLDPDTRIAQTIDTATSIIEKVKGARIYLLEGGAIPLQFPLREKLMEVYDDIIDFSGHPFIQFAHEHVDIDKQGITAIKGPCESFMVKEACKLIIPSARSRIFKISGRYRLSDRFNLDQHRDCVGKYALKRLAGLEYYADPTKTTYSPYQYSTRLYSFCGSILHKGVENAELINHRLLTLYANQQYIDIEHMSYLTINPDDVVTCDTIGVTGTFAEAPEWKLDE